MGRASRGSIGCGAALAHPSKEVSMICPASPVATIHDCFGIVLHHRAEWWLVEFPDRGGTPIRAFRLSGTISDLLRDSFRRRKDDYSLPNDIASLSPSPSSNCWCGDFALVRSASDEDRFDIEFHPWGAEASELDARLARTMVDATLFPIPSGFISVFGALPDEDVPVLAIRASGYVSATFELLTACYMPTYRPRSPWRDLSGDAVSDSGCDILGWTPAEDWIKPRKT
jgi:hypothetical protein